MRFRKKPVIIEAIQYTGSNSEEIQKFTEYKAIAVVQGLPGPFGYEHYLLVSTLEGEMKAQANDWIIKGVNGEFYPCKPDIFEKTYERVEE